MPSPTKARGLLEHFPRGADPPAVNQHASPLPVLSLTSSSLRKIWAARAGGGGARGGTGGCKSPRDGGGESRGGEGRSRYGRGMKRGTAEAKRVTPETTETTDTKTSGRRRNIEDLFVSTRENSAGGKYPVGIKGTEESVDKISEWIRGETEELVSEEEAESAVGEEEVERTLTEMSEESEGSVAEDKPRVATAGGGATSDATSKDADAAGAGGRHGAGKR